MAAHPEQQERARTREAARRRAAGMVERGPLATCGTRTAYERHRRRGEPIDDACRVAQAEWMRARRANHNTSMSCPGDTPMTTVEIARATGLTERQIYSWWERGLIPHAPDRTGSGTTVRWSPAARRALTAMGRWANDPARTAASLGTRWANELVTIGELAAALPDPLTGWLIRDDDGWFHVTILEQTVAHAVHVDRVATIVPLGAPPSATSPTASD